MKASIVAGEALGACQHMLNHHENLDECQAEIEDALGDFALYRAMITHGTESPAFRESPAGKMYIKNGLDLVVHAGNAAIQAGFEEIAVAEAAFVANARAMIDAHQARVAYDVVLDGERITLPQFMINMELSHRIWVAKLRRSVDHDVEFDGQTDPTKCMFGRWVSTLESDDDQLMNLIAATLEDMAGCTNPPAKSCRPRPTIRPQL